MADKKWDFTGLKAVFFNGTLTKSPEPSHTDLLIEISTGIMEKHGVKTEVIRTIDQDIATGVYTAPDWSAVLLSTYTPPMSVATWPMYCCHMPSVSLYSSVSSV